MPGESNPSTELITTQPNQPQTMQDGDPDEIPDKPSRQELFIRNLFLFDSVLKAAITAGYTEGYARGPIYSRIKTKAFQNKLREYAVSHELLNIPRIMRLERDAIKYLQGKPEELPKFASILKQKKIVAGLIQAETTHNVTMINIKEAQNMMINMPGNANPGISSDVDAAK